MSVRSLIRRVLYRFRSAVTGRYVSEEYAREHPKSTVRERDRR